MENDKPTTPSNKDPLKEQNKFLAIQDKWVDWQIKQTEVKGKELEYNHSYSIEALKTNAVDQKENRSHAFKMTILYSVVCFLFLSAGTLAVIYCLNNGHKDFAIDIVKICIPALVTGISGYFYGKSVSVKKHDSDYSEVE